MENQEGNDRSIRLTYSQYKDYLKEIIQIVDSYNQQNEEDPTQAAVIEAYLQKKVDFFKSEEEATRVASVLDHVIDYMISKERVLVSGAANLDHYSGGQGPSFQKSGDQRELHGAAHLSLFYNL